MTEAPPMAVIDAHVHLYACHELPACLDHARANFVRAGGAAAPGVLMLCEMAYEDRFSELMGHMQRGEAVGRWRIESTDEHDSLLARDDAGAVMAITAGRQIVTSEGLEVLAHCSGARFEDRVPIERAIRAAADADALVVLPYGVGKWSGRRGRIMDALLQQAHDPPLLLGDNGNRLAGAPAPRLLRHARQTGAVVLPGSDPLPLPGQDQRIGSYAMMLPIDLDLSRPAGQLRRTLRGLDRSPRTVGRLTGLTTFVRAQWAMQMRKRR